MTIGIFGIAHGALQAWGDGAWFRLELDRPPLVWWALPTSLIFWVFGAVILFGLVSGFIIENARRNDTLPWIFRWQGVVLAAAVSLAASYGASRLGVALFEDRIVQRTHLLGALETVPDDRIIGLGVSCQMVRRPRSVRAGDVIDRPTWYLDLSDGSRVRLGGVRGAALGGLSQPSWLAAMHRLDRYPRRPIGALDARCVNAVVGRFPAADQPFVRTLFEWAP